MSSTPARGLDPVAVLAIALIVCVVVAAGIVVLRRRGEYPRWLRFRRGRKRLDVIRRDLDRLADYAGTLLQSGPGVRQPFEFGRGAVAACYWDRAIDDFRRALASASRVHRIPLLSQIGACHYVLGNLGEALRHFEESALLAEQQVDDRGQASALVNIGVIRHEHGELYGALKQFGDALAIARRCDDQQAMALCLNNIGNIYHETGNLDRALELHEESLATSRRIGDEPGVVSGLINIGNIYRDKGQLDKALEFYADALADARSSGYKIGEAVELDGTAGVYRDRGDFDMALDLYEEALALARTADYRVGIATELGNIGLVLVAKGAHEQAVTDLAEALTTFLTTGVVNGPLQTVTGLAKCEDALGRERVLALLKAAGVTDGGTAGMFERIDQLRRRRPWRRKKPAGPTAPERG